jgi:serine/threonine-protein kinase
MGEVWKARQVSLDRTVALKILSAEHATDPEFVIRFEKEATALAALSHPNIVQIIDRGAVPQSGVFFFAMELVEGKNLRDVLAEEPPPSRSLRLVAQICRAIEYAHGKGVIHRDLKPENILLDEKGNTRVVDFGLAGLRSESQRMDVTRTATAMGTLNYMAPEQRRDAKSVDERADLYSIGVILYELLTGEPPLGRFKLPSERRDGLDTRVDKIIAKSLEPDPAARYPDAAAMLLEVEAVLGTVDAVPANAGAGLLRRERTPGIRRKASSSKREPMAVAVLLAGVALGVALFWYSREEVAVSGRQERASIEPSPSANEGHLMVDAQPEAGAPPAIRVRFRPGKTVLRAYSGEWRLDRGALVALRSGRSQERRAGRFALLESMVFRGDGLTVETTLRLDSVPSRRTPGGGAASRAGIVIRSRRGLRVELSATPGDAFPYRLTYSLVNAEGRRVEESVFGKDVDGSGRESGAKELMLRVRVANGEVVAHAAARGKPLAEVFRRALPGAIQGRVGLFCVGARCRFSDLRIAGHPMAFGPEGEAPHAEPAGDER